MTTTTVSAEPDTARHAVVYDPKSGRRMTVLQTAGVQFYTAGIERPGTGFKDGQSYGKFDAFCLETQYFRTRRHIRIPSAGYLASTVLFHNGFSFHIRLTSRNGPQNTDHRVKRPEAINVTKKAVKRG
jgi:hypothetical protein